MSCSTILSRGADRESQLVECINIKQFPQLHWKAEIKTRTFAAEGLWYMLLGWKVWPIVMCCLASLISEGDFIWELINKNPKKMVRKRTPKKISSGLTRGGNRLWSAPLIEQAYISSNIQSCFLKFVHKLDRLMISRARESVHKFSRKKIEYSLRYKPAQFHDFHSKTNRLRPCTSWVILQGNVRAITTMGACHNSFLVFYAKFLSFAIFFCQPLLFCVL